MTLLYRFTPHARLSQNPLFARETRRVRWGSSAEAMIHHSGWWSMVVCAAIFVVWTLVLLISGNGYQAQDTSIVFAMITFVLSLLASLALDYVSMSSAIASVNQELGANQWDLLRLTPLSDRQIIAAKHGVAQVRTWGLMMLIIGSRLAVLLMLIVNAVIIFLHNDTYRYLDAREITNAIVGQLLLVALSLLFVIEPFLRMRTVTALGIAISARTRQPVSAVAAAVGTVGALWLAQGLLTAALALGLLALILPLTLLEASVNQLVFCSPLLFFGVLLAAFYGFYGVLQTWGLRRAERWIARLN